MPFQSRAQAGWAFATGQPFARRWARQTGPYKRLPYKKRKKSYTLTQLEAFVSSPHYDAQTASLIAFGISALPSLKGEQIAPGITRIHGNLCNVHGRYGPCDKALSGKKPKGGARKPRKPAKTDAQRAAERAQHQAERQAETTAQQARNMTKVADDTGLGDDLANLDQFAQGKPLRPQDIEQLSNLGLLEIGADGTPRKSAQANVLLNAAKRGDTQGAKDAASRARDQVAKRAEQTTARATRQQEAATRRAQAEAKRRQREQERAARGGGGSKKPEKEPAKPLRVRPTKRLARSSAPSVGGLSSSAPKPRGEPPPKPEKPAKAPAKQIAPKLQSAAQSLSDGKELSEDDQQALIRNGLARIVKGELVLTAAGQRQTLKSFRIFKDASGRYRWVAQSSTAFQDRDKEIVSTKALADDCAFADRTGSYGPLRWWHSPGLDLGDCDFNAMHGRVLIESGTFRSPAIAQKVAAAADGLEISLGFLHLPSEPDADGVFHHIRRFERSLVPRGKASNRFTAFTVKETRTMFDPTKVAALKTLGFSDDDITSLQSQAEATEKAAADQGVAYKADEPAELPDLVINGVTYKALPPSPPVEEEAVIEEDAIDEMPMDEAPAGGGLTLSPEDLSAISEAVATALQAGIAQVMGALDLEKKVAGHVQGLMAPYTAQKDAEAAERAEQIVALQTSLKAAEAQQTALKAQLDELLGLQPAVVQRPSESTSTVVNPWIPSDQQLLESVKHQAPNDQFAFGDLVTNLFGNINTPGQA